MRNIQVIWRGPVHRAGGYGTASREYALALARQGVDVKVAGKNQGAGAGKVHPALNRLISKRTDARKRKIAIYHGTPNHLNVKKARRGFERIILNTVWETSRIPRNWFPAINHFDAICVPSTHNKKALIHSGVRVPIFVVPHGVHSHVYTPRNRALPLKRAKGTFVFLSVFGFQHRKNPETLLRAYWEEFSASDRTMLVMKTNGYSGRENAAWIKRRMLAYKKRLGIRHRTAPFVLVPGFIQRDRLRQLYRLGHVFVLPTRGEGVGLPFLESLASGVPVIATGWGGHMDFLNGRNAFFIDYKLAPPAASMNSKHAISRQFRYLFAQKGQLWAEASVGSLRKLMRFAYQHPQLCKKKGLQGRRDVRQLSWDRSGAVLKRVIERVLRKG